MSVRMIPFEIVMAITFPLGAVEWSRRSRPADLVDALSVAWVSIVASITLTGLVLSELNRLGSPAAWALGGILCALLPFATRLPRTPLGPIVSRTWRAVQRCAVSSWRMKLMLLTVIGCALANLITIAATAPGNADVLAYHLPKMGYAVQSGSFDLPYANYWAQQVHPHNGTALLIWTFLATGGNDHWMPLWQFASYWIAIASVAGLARAIGAGVPGALFAGCVFGLLTNALGQSVDAGNDLILAAHTGVCALMIVRAARDGNAWRWPVAGIAAGAALGTKALFLIAMPSLACLFAAVWRHRPSGRRNAVAAVVAVVGFVVLAGTAGFVDNYRRWGDPFLGPPNVRQETTFAGRSAGYRIVNGTRNLARYVLDSLSADGVPPVPIAVHAYRAVRAPLVLAFQATGWDLESTAGTRATFTYDRRLSSHEYHAHWGILGVLLIWPAMILGIVRGRGLTRALAIGGALAFPLQAYTALYDPWHGRYFLSAAIFLVPIAGAMSEHASWSRYWNAAAVFGCASAVATVLFRSMSPLIGTSTGGIERRSILRMDRVEQLSRGDASLAAPLRIFDRIVPANAAVQITVEGNTREYVFFGEGLGRRLHPRPPGGPVPASDWLLSDERLEPPAATDLPLGAGLWLRKPVSSPATAAGR